MKKIKIQLEYDAVVKVFNVLKYRGNMKNTSGLYYAPYKPISKTP